MRIISHMNRELAATVATKLLGLDDWEENKHPRDESGRFAGGSSGGAASEKHENKTETPGSTPKLKESTELPAGFTEDPDFDLFELLTSMASETPEEAAARETEEARKAKERREREDYGQNGLSESEYPEELRLTDQEREAVFDVLRSYRDTRHQTSAGADVISALQGMQTPDTLNQREKQLTKELTEANEMIAQRKAEGYSYKEQNAGTTGAQRKKAWWDFYNEHGHAPDPAVGERGIRHWQNQRKRALENLSSLKLARKITERNEFVKKSEHYVPWRKSPNAENPQYKPWEGRDGGPGSGNWGHRGRPGKRGGSGKGSGGKAFRSGNRESGYTSFRNHEEFQGILHSATKHRNSSNFRLSLTPSQHSALMEQKAICAPDEKELEYYERIYSMLSSGKQVPKPPEGSWESRLSEEEMDLVDREIAWRHAENLGQAIATGAVHSTKRVLDIIGKKSGWDKTILERNFDNLDEEELTDINYLLDQFPWSDDPKYAKIANEEDLLSDSTTKIRQYYLAMKAKSLGIEDVTIPERPAELAYAMSHPSAAEEVASKNGGYVHTKAGDAHRESVRQKLNNEKIVASCFAGPAGVKYKDVIAASVDNMDDDIAEVVDRTLGNANITWMDSDGRSNYDGHGTITLYTRRGEDSRSPEDILATFWHEYGHFAEHDTFSESGVTALTDPIRRGLEEWTETQGPTGIVQLNKAYVKAAEKDIQSLLEAAGLGDEFYASREQPGERRVVIRRKSDGAALREGDSYFQDRFRIEEAVDLALKKMIGYDEYLNFMREHGEPEEVDRSKYLEDYTTPKRNLYRTREKFKGAKEAYQQALIKRSQDHDHWIREIGEDTYQRLVEQKRALWDEYERRRDLMGYVTDSLDESVYGLFGMVVSWGGHEIDYYRRKPAIETTANVFMIRAINNPEVNAFMEKVIPNIATLHTQAWRMRRHETGRNDNASPD